MFLKSKNEIKVNDISNENNKVEEIQKKENDYKIDEYINYEIIDDSQMKWNESIYYLALGDSLTKGIGDEQNKNGFTKRLVEKIEQFNIRDVYLDNRGKRGRRSDQLLKLIKKGHYDEEIENAHLITMTIGGNDIMKVVKKDLLQLEKEAFDKERIEFGKRLKKIVSEIHARNSQVPIILIGLYNPFEMLSDEIKEFDTIVNEWNETIENIALNHSKACYVKVHDLFDSNSNMVYHSDFFHPNGYGYTMITERILLNMMECDMFELNQLILFKKSSYNKR